MRAGCCRWSRSAIIVLFLSAGAVLSLGRSASAAGEGGGGAHVDPFSYILIELAALILIAMVGRWVAAKVKQPSVLGELVVGVVAGNIGYAVGLPLSVVIMGLGSVQSLMAQVWATGLPVANVAPRLFSPDELAPGGIGHQLVELLTGPGANQLVIMATALWMFSNLGVIVLLFMVGLESTVEEMLRVGPRSLAVAVVGIVAPFVLGYLSSAALLPGASTAAHLFIGATLSATSVGITARVFKDLRRLQSPEAKVILGAAVIDDVLGLIILAIVVGIVVSGGVQFGQVLRIGLSSAFFLGAVMLYGERLVRLLMPVMSALDRTNLRLLFPLALACVLSWLANMINLAPIVGAFAAGLILNEEHFPDREGDHEATITRGMHPLEAIFAPAFFVLMGMQVNLATFASSRTIGLALAVTAAAFLGKLVSGLPAGRGTDRLSVGIGMVPRGEVGLIFASIGKAIGVVTDAVFSSVVMMVIVTTLAAPLLLQWSLFRKRRRRHDGAARPHGHAAQ